VPSYLIVGIVQQMFLLYCTDIVSYSNATTVVTVTMTVTWCDR